MDSANYLTNTKVTNISRATGIKIIVAALLLLSFFALRVDVSPKENSVDERIVLIVSEQMTAKGNLDPNWDGPAMPPYFRFPQYNFYSYNVMSHILIGAAKVIGVSPILVLRATNVFYQFVALIFVLLAFRRLGASDAALFLVAALITFMPAMVHEAHIARCESLLYAIFAAVLYLASAGRLMVAALVVGIGMASKMTFAAAGLILLPALLTDVRRIPSAALACGVGFAVFAPYAILQPGIFLDGLRWLSRTYYAPFPPHSLMDPTPIKNAGHALSFFLVLYGAVVPLGLLSILWIRDRVLIGIWLASVVTLLYFAPVPMFIERNFSLAVFGFIVVLATSPQLPARLATALSIALMAYWSTQIALSTHELAGERRLTWERANHTIGQMFWWETFRDESKVPVCTGLMAVPYMNDDYSRAIRDYLLQNGHAEVAHYASRFSFVPTSTLHTYLDADVYYYRC